MKNLMGAPTEVTRFFGPFATREAKKAALTAGAATFQSARVKAALLLC
jgi:hypothetical protein